MLELGLLSGMGEVGFEVWGVRIGRPEEAPKDNVSGSSEAQMFGRRWWHRCFHLSFRAIMAGLELRQAPLAWCTSSYLRINCVEH